MTVTINALQAENESDWNGFVDGHPQSSAYHWYGWRNVITKCYGHRTHYIAALRDPASAGLPAGGIVRDKEDRGNVSCAQELCGVLPLVHMRNWIFGNELVSMPFFDSGGVLVEDESAEAALLGESVCLAESLGVRHIELRHQSPLLGLSRYQTDADLGTRIPIPFGSKHWYLATAKHKVRMLLSLPDSPDLLMKSFKAKLRSQIGKPIKEKLTARIGGGELINDFYSVFVTNMRDLGSPVHSIRMFIEVLGQFPSSARVVVVYKEKVPVASSVIVGFNKVLANPWASSLRQYSRLAPSMLLYWTMLEFACQNGYSVFDFGRSTPGDGTYRFKKQWEATPVPLFWYRLSRELDQSTGGRAEEAKMRKAVAYWRRLPVFVTRLLGPMIRKHISL
jgi:FemAB-related protein (PEP-CTERM system-associated)